jgi:hypothetical protein
VVVVEDEHVHRPLLPQRLARDPAVDHDVAADDLDRLARQADDPLDVGLRRLARVVEDRDLPSPRAPEVVKELLDEHPVAAARDRRHASEVGLATVRADRAPGPPVLIEPEREPRPAIGADDLLVVAQERRGHRAGGHDVRLGSEGPEDQDAEAQDDQELDRLTRETRPERRFASVGRGLGGWIHGRRACAAV